MNIKKPYYKHKARYNVCMSYAGAAASNVATTVLLVPFGVFYNN